MLQRCSWTSVVLVCVTILCLFCSSKEQSGKPETCCGRKNPFFDCLFSLFMHRHLEVLLRFQPIPLSSFNYRRGLVIYLLGEFVWSVLFAF